MTTDRPYAAPGARRRLRPGLVATLAAAALSVAVPTLSTTAPARAATAKAPAATAPARAATAKAPAATASAATTTTTLLRYGARGPAVVSLQRQLAALRYDVGAIDGVFGSDTQHAVVAFQKVQGIGRDGVVGPVTSARLAHPARPHPRFPMAGSTLEVDLTHQVVYLTQRATVVRILDASTGSGQYYWQGGTRHVAVTPTGRFAIYARYSGWQTSPLGVLWRPHYFYGGYAVHGSPSVPPWPASHGCVRVTVSAMNRLAPALRIGMPVAVYR